MESIESGRNQPTGLTLALMRAKLTEPVRFYLWSIFGLVVLGLVLAGWATDQWAAYLQAASGVVLGLMLATWAVRASTWSQAAHLASLRQLHAVQDVQRALGEAA